MQEKLLSILIPVYNCEQYIGRCLESVLAQTYGKFEVILLNDGSTDGTAQICKDYSAKDCRIKYVEQSNQGVAGARRRAVQLAAGAYIGFVDADDYIEPDMYAQLVENVNGVDMVTSDFYFNEKRMTDRMEAGVYRSPEELKYFYSNMLIFGDTKGRGISTNLWSKLFVASKLKEIVETTALEVFYGEDAEILFKYILQCEAICVTRICAYHYGVNDNSISTSVNKNYLNNVNRLYWSLADVFSQSAYREILLPKWQQQVEQMLQIAPRFMGFVQKKNQEPIRYLNPYVNLLRDKRIVLYGAGKVGKDYYRLYGKMGIEEPVLWVDAKPKRRQQEGYPVWSIEKMLDLDFDYVIVAVKQEKLAEEITTQLQQAGIECSKILWQMPVNLEE